MTPEEHALFRAWMARMQPEPEERMRTAFRWLYQLVEQTGEPARRGACPCCEGSIAFGLSPSLFMAHTPPVCDPFKRASAQVAPS